MKKFFIVLAAAALALSACSKVETVENELGSKITFQTANFSTQTKAVSVLDDFKAFQCRAFLHAQGVDIVDGVDQGTCQEFFGANGETISPDNATTPTKWSTEYSTNGHAYYWPKDAASYVNFVAWYGKSGENAVTPTIAYTKGTGDNAKWTATMTWNFTTTLGQATSNLMYADMAWRYKENVKKNEAGDNGYWMNSVTEGVPMLFHHALAQINVKAYVSGATTTGDGTLTPTDAAPIGTGVTDNIASWTVKLTNAKLGKIYSAGKLELTNEDPGTASTPKAWTGDWEGTGSAADVTVSELTVTAVTKDGANDFIAASCVLPQDLVTGTGDAATKVALVFDLDITTTYGTGTSAVTHHEIIPVSINLSDMGTNHTAWNKNTKYTYYLRIVPNQNKVLFDPALEAEWTVTTVGEKEI